MQDNRNQKYTDMGSIIRDSVMNAVNSGDFTGLSETIFDAIGSIGNEARAMAQSYHMKQEDEIRRNKERRSVYVRKPDGQSQIQNVYTVRKAAGSTVFFKDVGFVSAILSMLFSGFSIVFAAPSFLITFAMLLDKEFMMTEGAGFIGVPLFCGVWLGTSIAGLCYGLRTRKLLNSARRFFKICGDKMYASIDDLARATGSTYDKTLKKVRKMLAKGYFPEGYLDQRETTLIISSDVYKQYLATEANQRVMEAQRLEEMKITAERANGLSMDEIAEYNGMIQEGTTALVRLKELNDSIPGEAITDKLNRLEGILEEIFDSLREHVEQMKNCHKLLDYYLPTMLKLVETYDEYDKLSVKGPDVLSAMAEIEKTLDSINEAFVQLLNRMFKDSAWDVKADAKVLRTMLHQEGLTNELSGTQQISENNSDINEEVVTTIN